VDPVTADELRETQQRLNIADAQLRLSQEREADLQFELEAERARALDEPPSASELEMTQQKLAAATADLEAAQRSEALLQTELASRKQTASVDGGYSGQKQGMIQSLQRQLEDLQDMLEDATAAESECRQENSAICERLADMEERIHLENSERPSKLESQVFSAPS